VECFLIRSAITYDVVFSRGLTFHRSQRPPPWPIGFRIHGRSSHQRSRPLDLSEHDRLREMLKNLLKERFKLAVHFEKKEVPGHELVVARDGVKMKEA